MSTTCWCDSSVSARSRSCWWPAGRTGHSRARHRASGLVLPTLVASACARWRISSPERARVLEPRRRMPGGSTCCSGITRTPDSTCRCGRCTVADGDAHEPECRHGRSSRSGRSPLSARARDRAGAMRPGGCGLFFGDRASGGEVPEDSLLPLWRRGYHRHRRAPNSPSSSSRSLIAQGSGLGRATRAAETWRAAQV